MTYEAWRATFQSDEQATRAAFVTVERLHSKMKELEAQLAESHGLRPEVLAFALLMEQRLREKDEERGVSWKFATARDLFPRLMSKAFAVEKASGFEDITVAKQAVDCANFCMMIADVVGGLVEHRLCGKRTDGSVCKLLVGSSCPDCGRSLIDYSELHGDDGGPGWPGIDAVRPDSARY